MKINIDYPDYNNFSFEDKVRCWAEVIKSGNKNIVDKGVFGEYDYDALKRKEPDINHIIFESHKQFLQEFQKKPDEMAAIYSGERLQFFNLLQKKATNLKRLIVIGKILAIIMIIMCVAALVNSFNNYASSQDLMKYGFGLFFWGLVFAFFHTRKKHYDYYISWINNKIDFRL